MNVSSWLKKPFPFVADFQTKFLISFAFGVFIYLFLLVFQPFGIDSIIVNKAIYLLGFGFVTFFVLLFTLAFLPLILRKTFDLDKWNIGKEIGFIILNVTFISLFNYVYDTAFSEVHTQDHSLYFFIPVTIAVGIIPVTIMVFFFEIYLRERNEKSASEISSKIQHERYSKGNAPNKPIVFTSETGKELLSIDDNHLVFIKSEDNYCKVYFNEGNSIQTSLLRITLKNIENQLVAFPDILRCHRSYIVNKKKVFKITGNARAYNVHFENCKETAAISRSFSKESLL